MILPEYNFRLGY